MRILRSGFQQLLSCLCKNISLLRATSRVKYRRLRDHPASVPLWRSAEMRRRGFADDINPIVSGSSQKKRSILRLRRIQWNKSYDVPNASRERERYRSGAKGNESGATSPLAK